MEPERATEREKERESESERERERCRADNTERSYEKLLAATTTPGSRCSPPLISVISPLYEFLSEHTVQDVVCVFPGGEVKRDCYPSNRADPRCSAWYQPSDWTRSAVFNVS